MDIRQLNYVLAIANAGSMGRAATQIGLTQQALSKSLARLENSLGGKLFERTSHGMILTPLGYTVCKHAREIIVATGRLRSAVDSELHTGRGRIVIGLSPVAASSRAGMVITEFAKSHPALRIDIEAGIGRDFAQALSLGRIDLAVATDVEGSQDAHLRESINVEVWGIAGRVEHPVLETAEALADLKDARWLLGRNTELLNDKIETTFSQAGLVAPAPAIMTTSVFYALTALQRSDYLAILPKSLCQLPGLVWKDFSQSQWQTPIFLMRRKQAQMSLLAQRMANLLRKSGGQRATYI